VLGLFSKTAFILFSLSVFVAPVFAQGSVCQITPLNDPRVLGRAGSVNFPDGRQITVVGHHHGFRQIYSIYNSLVSGNLERMTDQEFTGLLRRIATQNAYELPLNVSREGRKAILAQKWKAQGIDLSLLISVDEGYEIGSSSVQLHAAQDYSFLKDVVLGKTSLKSIQFVGNEAVDAERDLMATQIREAYQGLKGEVDKRKAAVSEHFTQAQLEELYLSIMNGHNYLYISDSGLMSQIPNFGVESSEAIARYDREAALNKIEALWRNLLKAHNTYWAQQKNSELKNDKVFVQFLSYQEALRDDVESMIIDNAKVLENRIARVSPWTPVWLKAETEALYQIYRVRIAVNQERDMKAVVAMVNRKESGLHFVGQNHLKLRLQYLLQKCQEEQNGNFLWPWLR
jgi:hypothetical protein